MAAFDEINSGPGQDKFSVFYVAYNATMAFLKDALAGKVLTANGAGAPVWSYPTIQFVIAEIGDWNMDSTSNVTVALPSGVTSDKIRMIQVMIRADSGASGGETLIPLNSGHHQSGGDCFGATTDYEPQGGIDFAQACAGSIQLYRKTAGFFDSADYNATSYNRGFITIGYTQ